jgi:hypothetical protein
MGRREGSTVTTRPTSRPLVFHPREYQILLGAVAVALILLTGCSQATTIQNTSAVTPVDVRAAIHIWSASGGQDRTSAISKDLADVAATAAVADITGMRTACTSLQTHVQTAQAYASIPDTPAQIHWSNALTQAAQASADCIAFTHNLDPALLTRSGHELKAYDTEISKLSDRINALDLLHG